MAGSGLKTSLERPTARVAQREQSKDGAEEERDDSRAKRRRGDEGMGRGTQEGSLSGGECDMRTSGSMAAGNRGGLVAPRV